MTRPSDDHIARTLAALETAWRADPTQRLGQLVVNAARATGTPVECPEVFYLPDDKLVAALDTPTT